MNIHSPQRIALLFLVMALGVSGFLYYSRYQNQRAMTAQLTSLLSESMGNFYPAPRIKFTGCVMSGALPDHNCTPGALFLNVALEQICKPGYTKTVRYVPMKLRKSIFAAYGVAYPEPHGAYELDHFIPLALGGNNDAANLFPEPAEPSPGFHEKDIVEIWIYQEVCAGRVSLGAAQKQISSNWLAVYNNLLPEDIARIKSEFKSWSN